MAEIASCLKALVGKSEERQKVAASPPPVSGAGAARPKVHAAPAEGAGAVPGTPKPPGRAREMAGLDPTVVQAALSAGLQPQKVLEVRDLLGRRGGKLADFPNTAAGVGLASPRPSSVEVPRLWKPP